MDNHFNNILNIFKRLDEAANPAQQADMKKAGKKPKSEGQIEKTSTGLNHRATNKYGAGDEPFNPFNPGKYARDINHLNKALTSKLDKGMGVQHSHGNTKDVDEGNAKHDSIGPKFGGYWKGTDPNPPRPGMGVGGSAEESIEEQIAREYTQYLREYGMTTGGMAGTGSTANNPVDQAKMNKEIQQTQQNLNKFKAAGVQFPSGVGQAAKSTVATVNNQAATATGQGMDQQAKKTAMGLGQEMEKLMTTGNQSQVQQVANVIKQAKLGQGTK